MLLGVSTVVWADEPSNTSTVTFNIPQQAADRALTLFAEQADLTLIFPPELVGDKEANELIGTYTHEEGAKILLDGTGLAPSFSNEVVMNVTIDDTSSSGENAMNATKKVGLFAIIAGALSGGVEAQEPGDESAQSEQQSALPTLSQQRDSEEISKNEEAAKAKRGLAEFVTIDEIIVRGKNVGVRRFEDDPQPYIIFNSDDIERSHATNLEEFLRTRLPQNAQPGSARQFQTGAGQSPGNVSTIDLRGLGQEETLILVNGRRAPRVSLGNDFRQADINGIPLGSIERIEILPSTASGIYGGGATGGVINIITRRNYVGGEVLAEYSNTFDTDVGQRSISGTYGFALEDGKTNVQVSASYSDSNELLVRDRDFAQKSRDLLERNDPDGISLPLGTTPNIRSLFGNLILDDGTDLGSQITFVPLGYAGLSSDGGAALVQNAGQFNFELPSGAIGTGARLIQAPTTESYSLSATREFSPTFDVYLDATYSRNEGEFVTPSTISSVTLRPTDPANPFQNFVQVRFANPIEDTFVSQVFSDSTQLIGGFNWRFAERWTANFDYNWGLSSIEAESDGTPFNTSSFSDVNDPDRIGIAGAIALGVTPEFNGLDIFRDINASPLDFSPYRYETPGTIQFPQENESTNVAFRLSGSAFDLPAGPVNVSFLAESRESQIKGAFQDSIVPNSPPPGTRSIEFVPPREQSVDSLYAEAIIPLFSDAYNLPFVNELDLQVSIRYDDYESASPAPGASATLESLGDPIPEFDIARNSFDSVDYTLGFRYKPVDDILLRGSFATGFLPPNVTQIFQNELENAFLFEADPQRDGELIVTVPTQIFGGREDLRPEESESWSLGIIITPRQIPGFRFSIDYTLIEKDDEIGALSVREVLDLEDLFPERVQRNALTPADEAAGFTVGTVNVLDVSLINLERTTVESFDVQIDQLFETESWGEFRFYGIGTYTERVERQILPESPLVDRVGFDDGPLEWRANLGVTWESPSSNLALGWNAQYYDDYLVYGVTATDSQIDEEVRQHGRDKVPSQLFHDVTLTYRLDSELLGGVLSDTEFRIGIQNLFDEEPFIRPSEATNGRYSSYGDARLRRYSVSVRKSF